MTDQVIRDRLKDIDDGERDVSSWESGFIESICFKYQGNLTEKQRGCAEKIIEKYA